MSEAMELIVDAYAKLRARKALEDLKAHRYRLATELKSINSPLDPSISIKQIEKEIEIIEAGLAKLDTPAALWAPALGLGFQSRAS